jgi:hypothetical protein
VWPHICLLTPFLISPRWWQWLSNCYSSNLNKLETNENSILDLNLKQPEISLLLTKSSIFHFFSISSLCLPIHANLTCQKQFRRKKKSPQEMNCFVTSSKNVIWGILLFLTKFYWSCFHLTISILFYLV